MSVNQMDGDFPCLGQLQGQRGTVCRYGMFDRNGGISENVYSSLNVSLHIGDDEAAVHENRQTVKRAMGVDRLLSAHQIHDTNIYVLSNDMTDDVEVDGYDALMTDLAGVGLMIQQADCQAVLLFDPVREAIAAVHCGWRGSVQNILARVVAAMAENYATEPDDLYAVVSPSLGPCCAEFINYKDELPHHFQKYMVTDDHFDFWRITMDQLLFAGLQRGRVSMAEICTSCSDTFFSYRRACRQQGGRTGRNCSVIAMG